MNALKSSVIAVAILGLSPLAAPAGELGDTAVRVGCDGWWFSYDFYPNLELFYDKDGDGEGWIYELDRGWLYVGGGNDAGFWAWQPVDDVQSGSWFFYMRDGAIYDPITGGTSVSSYVESQIPRDPQVGDIVDYVGRSGVRVSTDDSFQWDGEKWQVIQPQL